MHKKKIKRIYTFILLIKSDLKWCIHLRRSHFLYFVRMVEIICLCYSCCSRMVLAALYLAMLGWQSVAALPTHPHIILMVADDMGKYVDYYFKIQIIVRLHRKKTFE